MNSDNTAIHDLHIDDFYRDCARIFLQLHRSFPRRTMLYVEDIAGPGEVDDFGLPSDRHQACFGAMLWLADHDYLSYQSTVSYEAIDQTVLSQRGFNLLASIEKEAQFYQQPSENLSQQSLSRAQLLRHKLKHQSSITLGEYVHHLLSL